MVINFSFVGVRILCLDGGGSRGLVMTMAIEKLEEILNSGRFHDGKVPEDESRVKLWQLFDLVAGKKMYMHVFPNIIHPSPCE